MKTLRLLASTALVLTVLGLSACGGGGDDAGEPLAPLTAGLTVTASTGNVPANGTYNLKVYAEDAKIPDPFVPDSFTYSADGGAGNPDEDVLLFVQVDSDTYALQKVVLIDATNTAAKKTVGCGFSGFSCGNKVTVNESTGEIRLNRIQLKELSRGENVGDGSVLRDADTAVVNGGGSLTASGILAPFPG